MNRHQETRNALYEYLTEELDPAERARVEEHLLTCSVCRDSLTVLREAFAVLPKPETDPAAERPEEFWESFPALVERRLRVRPLRRWEGIIARIRDELLSFAVMRRGHLALTGIATGLCAIALALLLRPAAPPVALPQQQNLPPAVAEEQPPMTSEPTVSTPSIGAPRISPAAPPSKISAERVSDYFRKSKILLIGVTNLKHDQDSTPDLSTEQHVSRALVREARYLRQEPGLSPKAKELIDELNRVLIQLANLSEHNDASGIEIVRGGIRQENLLFKIRMAESAINVARPVPVSLKKEGSPL